ncbi:MAG: right-handed parallel beta-helix repeat-containing protein [Planctomycetota bacterium]
MKIGELTAGRSWRHRRAAGLLVVWAILNAACSPGPPAPSTPATPAGADSARAELPPMVEPEPRPERNPKATTPGSCEIEFGGCSGVLAGEDFVHVRWRPARALGHPANPPGAPAFRYRVYTSSERRSHDFSRPTLETAPGEVEARLGGLRRGEPLYVIVRAVNAAGVEDPNKQEWCATPNAVRYVVAGNASERRDGLTPTTAFASLKEATRSTIASNGVNIYLSADVITERVFLFDGMYLYGGFDREFSVARWIAGEQTSTIRAESDADLVAVAPGERPCGLHRLDLDGAEQGGRGVVADACEIELGAVTVRGFKRKGILLRTELEDSSRLRATLHETRSEQNAGEGLSIEGLADVLLIDCTFARNGQEGIEVDPLTATADDKGRLKVERCRVVDNGDIGIDVKAAPLAAEPIQGIIRVTVRDTVVSGNADHGLSIDVPEEVAAKYEIYIENNDFRGNQRAGVQLALDTHGEARIGYNVFDENGADGGLIVSGRSRDTIYWVHHNALAHNKGAGIRARRQPQILVRQCEIRDNLGAAIEAEGGWIDVIGCWIEANGRALNPTRLSYSVVAPEETIATATTTLGGVARASGDSALRDAGDPRERDADGTRADAGVGGGLLARPPGAGHHCEELVAVAYLSRVEPPLGSPLPANGLVRLQFCEALGSPPAIAFPAASPAVPPRAASGGGKLWEATLAAADDAATCQVTVEPTVGSNPVQPWALSLEFVLDGDH